MQSATQWSHESYCVYNSVLPQTVRVQGTDISHRLQISKVEKSDEGLYECRVTDANYGELREYKVQGHLQVNGTAQLRNKAVKKTAPLHLTDKKPRKANHAGAHDGAGSEQRVRSTSSSQTKSAKTGKHSHGSGTCICQSIFGKFYRSFISVIKPGAETHHTSTLSLVQKHVHSNRD